MEWLKRITLGKKQRENALKLALVKAKSVQQEVDSEENARLEKEAYQTLPVLSEGQEPPSDLECLIEGVTELNPQARQYFLDAVITQHYGIRPTKESPKSVIPYGDVRSQIEQMEELTKSLQDCIRTYLNTKPYKKEGRIALKRLVQLSILDQEETNIYLAAVKKLDCFLNKKSLRYSDEYNRSIKLKRNGTIAAACSLAITGAAVLVGNPILLQFSLFNLLWFVYEGKRFSPVGKEINYKKALINQLQKKGVDYDLHLKVALDYGKRLQERLINPSQLNREYSNHFHEIPERISRAKSYLSNSISTFESIEKKLTLTEKAE